MRLSISKTYCPTCRKLVKGKEQKLKNITRVLCPKCGGVIWILDGVSWRYVREGVPA